MSKNLHQLIVNDNTGDIIVNSVRNSKGEPTILTGDTALGVRRNQEIINSLGYQIPIDTLTAISQQIVEQKFFELPIADYVPVRVGGPGAWAQTILTYRNFSTAGDFEAGIMNTGSPMARMASADGAVDSVSVKVFNWMKEINWTIFDLELAARSGNWDLVASKEKARKRNWDLGLQRIAFLGSDYDSNIKGLLTLPNVNSNTTLITKYIKDMTAAEFNTFARGVIGAYRSNSNYTAEPTGLWIPELDFNGLATWPDATYPLKTKLALLKEAFEGVTGNSNFQIRKLAYADQVNNASVSGLNKNRYVLMNYSDDTLRMDIPVDYTNTQANTINGAMFQSAAFGQFTGVVAYRELEVLYFDWAA